MNTRRRLILVLVADAIAAPLVSFAQRPAKFARIGFLHSASPEGIGDIHLRAFRDGLRELGYVAGKNLQLAVPWGHGKLERLPALAAEPDQLKLDVLVAEIG